MGLILEIKTRAEYLLDLTTLVNANSKVLFYFKLAIYRNMYMLFTVKLIFSRIL